MTPPETTDTRYIDCPFFACTCMLICFLPQLYSLFSEQNEDNESDNEDGDEDGDGRHSQSRAASTARMFDMASEGVPESVYRSIEAQRLRAPRSGVKVQKIQCNMLVICVSVTTPYHERAGSIGGSSPESSSGRSAFGTGAGT